MASADTRQATSPLVPPIVFLAVLAMLAGAGGMVVSFLFLASSSQLDVIAGAVGFLAGAILIAAGLLSLAVLSRSSTTSKAATHAAGCLVTLIPPTVAILGWPGLYFAVSLAVIFIMPFVLIGCVGWAWVQSRSVSEHLAALLGWRRGRFLRAAVFAVQLVIIVESWPLFGSFLRLLESLGYKVGWS
ncbi:MAG TPA: hypothetical protein VH643_17920 [Gemmataceae bacterium]|jgi:hypothetical protein